MKTFSDSQGESWRIDISVGTLLDIKTELGLDLLDGTDDMPATIEQWVNVLWITLVDQVERREIKERDFAKRLLGDCLSDAIDAWLEEYAAFFFKIQPAKSKAITGMWQASKQLGQVTAKQLDSALGKLCSDLQGQ